MDAHDKAEPVAGRLDDLVFGRIATAPRPLTHGEVVKATRGFAPSTYDDGRWSAAIADATARLVAGGQVDGRRAEGGAGAAAARLGATGAPTWKRLHERIVPALALGLAADDARSQARLQGRDPWVAATIGRALGLWTSGPPPGLGVVCDALVWRTLALPGRPRRTPAELRAHFLTQLLGTGTGPPERRAALLAAREVGAVRADLRALREALVRRWLCGLAWSAVGDAPAAPAELDFSALVGVAADRATAGRFGPRKVFISTVWRDPAFAGLPLAEFKERLVAAHRAGTLTLARADLVGAMDPELVRESETTHLETRYHFVERRGPS